MYLVIHEVNKLQHVHIPYSDLVLKGFSCTSIKEGYHSVRFKICVLVISNLVQKIYDLLFLCSFENRSSNKRVCVDCGKTCNAFKNLPEVHPAWYTKWIQYHINRGTIRKVRHILYRHYSGNYSLITVSSCHFVTDGDLSELCDIYFYDHVDTRAHGIAIFFSGKGLYRNDLSS